MRYMGQGTSPYDDEEMMPHKRMFRAPQVGDALAMQPQFPAVHQMEPAPQQGGGGFDFSQLMNRGGGEEVAAGEGGEGLGSMAEKGAGAIGKGVMAAGKAVSGIFS